MISLEAEPAFRATYARAWARSQLKPSVLLAELEESLSGRPSTQEHVARIRTRTYTRYVLSAAKALCPELRFGLERSQPGAYAVSPHYLHALRGVDAIRSPGVELRYLP